MTDGRETPGGVRAAGPLGVASPSGGGGLWLSSWTEAVWGPEARRAQFQGGCAGLDSDPPGFKSHQCPPAPASQARLSQHSCSRTLNGPSVKWARHAPPGVTRTEWGPSARQVAAPDSDGTSCIGAPASAYARARLLLLPKRPLPSREGKHRDPGRQLAWSCCNEGPQTRASNTRRSFSPGSGARKSEAPGGQGAPGAGPSAPGGCRRLWARGHVPLLSASTLTRGARCLCSSSSYKEPHREGPFSAV